jgi:hypothetical protein
LDGAARARSDRMRDTRKTELYRFRRARSPLRDGSRTLCLASKSQSDQAGDA